MYISLFIASYSYVCNTCIHLYKFIEIILLLCVQKFGSYFRFIINIFNYLNLWSSAVYTVILVKFEMSLINNIGHRVSSFELKA